MGFTRDFWNRRGGLCCDRALFSSVAKVPRWKGRCDLCRSTFRPHATRDAYWCRHLDISFLLDALCLPGVGGSCRRAAASDRHYDSAKSKLWESAVLLVALYSGSCYLAASFKSFSANARQGTTLYPEVNIGRTAILGAGAWGTALAWLWGKNGRQISLWGHNVARIVRMQKTRENRDYLPQVKLPRSVDVTSELGDCAGADLIVFVTPSTALREIATRLRRVVANPSAVFLNCTKGIEHLTGMRMSQILREVFPGHRIAVLSGPNLAVEIAQNLPTATVIGCDDVNCAASLQGTLGSPRFRIYTSQDVASIELGGALKNVFALAAGISDGLGLGDNSKAALVTRSLAELVRLGVAMGGDANAFYGLSGAGDLIVTCYSEHSRNHTVGKRLGRGEPLDQITAPMKAVAEGIPTTRSAWECARRLNVDTPIIDQVYAVMYEQKKPTAALEELLSREQKAERL
jgi:glycerol-3-phosphate dehydrogenase (NAD(P)+)